MPRRKKVKVEPACKSEHDTLSYKQFVLVYQNDWSTIRFKSFRSLQRLAMFISNQGLRRNEYGIVRGSIEYCDRAMQDQADTYYTYVPEADINKPITDRVDLANDPIMHTEDVEHLLGQELERDEFGEPILS